MASKFKENMVKVLVTGVFDLLHQEHIKFLQAAKKAGDYLVVGVESDIRVKQIKGESRPIQDQNQRLNNIKNLKIADEVFILPEKFNQPEEHLALLQQLKPDLLAVSANSPNLEQKQKLMKQVGGEVTIVLEHNPKVSTSNIVNTRKQT